jgi:hypothetical protein
MPIKAPKNHQVVLEERRLVESPRRRLKMVERNPPGPRLCRKHKLVQIVEALLGLVNASKDVHGFRGLTCRVPVAALHGACNIGGPQPRLLLNTEYRESIESLHAVPPAENVHQAAIDARSVPKAQLDLRENFKVSWHVARLLAHDLSPFVFRGIELVDVREDVGFVPATVDKEHVLVLHKRMIGSRQGFALARSPQRAPSFALNAVARDVIEVGATLARVATEKVHHITVVNAVAA